MEKKTQLTVTLDLGNEAMQTPTDVVEALERSLKHPGYEHEPLKSGDYGPLTDLNGNAVGFWQVSEEVSI